MSDSPGNDLLHERLSALLPAAREARAKSPLVLAYIGDAVYELAVRTRLVDESDAPVNTLHRRAAAEVRASTQAQKVEALDSLLTDAEREIVRRARNTKSTVPRSASVFEYRYSTAFEALLGYLFLAGDMDRLVYILEQAIMIGDDRS